MPSKPYEIILKNNFGTWERQTLALLYLPIIGNKPFTLYNTMLVDGEFGRLERSITFDFIHLELIVGLSNKELTAAREVLEAMKLLTTFYNEHEQKYMFYLYAPLSPYDFFANKMFTNALIGRIGENEYEKLRFLFRDHSKKIDDVFSDISKSFGSVFKDEVMYPDFDKIANFNSKRNKRTSELTDQELKALVKLLKMNDIAIDFTNIKFSTTTKEIMDAFNLTIVELAECFKKSYNFNSHTFSRKAMCAEAVKIANAKNDTTELFKNGEGQIDFRGEKEDRKLMEFEKWDTIAYLKGLLKVKTLTASQLAMIAQFRNELKLHDSVINALIDFSFHKNEEKIVANYILKIGATLKELKINTAKETMIYLKKAFNNGSTSTIFKSQKTSVNSGRKSHKYVSQIEWTDDEIKRDLIENREVTPDNIDEFIGRFK